MPSKILEIQKLSRTKMLLFIIRLYGSFRSLFQSKGRSNLITNHFLKAWLKMHVKALERAKLTTQSIVFWTNLLLEDRNKQQTHENTYESIGNPVSCVEKLFTTLLTQTSYVKKTAIEHRFHHFVQTLGF